MIEFRIMGYETRIGSFYPISLLMNYKTGEIINIEGTRYEFVKREFEYYTDFDSSKVLVIVYVDNLY